MNLLKTSRLKVIFVAILLLWHISSSHGQSTSDESLQALVERQESLIRIVTYGALVPVALLFSFTFFFLYRRKRETDIREREMDLKFARTEMEMRALRAQVNPHFIFNCLSSIQHYIHHNNNEEAERYLVKFSRLIRQVLENSMHAFVSLSEDLDLLRLYIALESMRMEGGFSSEIQVHPDIDPTALYVPPMLLQPIVENAIWHGLSNRSGPPRQLKISFRMAQDRLLAEVRDNGDRVSAAAKTLHERKSFGLSLVRDRVALLGGVDQASVLQMNDIRDETGKYQGMCVSLIIPTE